MSTPKNEVTSTFLSLIEDRNLCIDLTDEEMTEILDIYLKDSTYLRFKNCLKDLSDHQPYNFHTDTFTADGIVKTYVITDYPTDPHVDAISYVAKVNDIDVNYTFDANTLTFTLDDLPSNGDTVEVGFDYYGEFTADLTSEEIFILAKGMVASWMSKILYNHENMKNKISTKDYKIFSPANLLDKIMTLKKESEIELRNLLISYSFNNFNGYNQD